MRHRKSVVKLGRTVSHRKAMFRNMVTSLFKYDRIRTTEIKAKELRGWADHIVTLAKRGDLHAMRQALSIIREKDVVYKVFDEAKNRYGDVSGGYTHLVKLGPRPGDAAPTCLIELVFPEKSSGSLKPKRQAKFPSRKKATQKNKTPSAPVAESVPASPSQDAASDSEGK